MAYTKEQEAVLTEAAEEGVITFARAGELAQELEVSVRSVIAKVKSMDLPYEPKPREAKRPKGMTKAELVDAIRGELPHVGEVLDGLTNAPAQALNALLNGIREVASPASE